MGNKMETQNGMIKSLNASFPQMIFLIVQNPYFIYMHIEFSISRSLLVQKYRLKSK